MNSQETQIAVPNPTLLRFCDVYKPVYSSVRDTEETRRQIDLNNAVWMEKCR